MKREKRLDVSDQAERKRCSATLSRFSGFLLLTASDSMVYTCNASSPGHAAAPGLGNWRRSAESGSPHYAISTCRRLAAPPLRPAARASSLVHSWAVPCTCAARPPLLAISRCSLRPSKRTHVPSLFVPFPLQPSFPGFVQKKCFPGFARQSQPGVQSGLSAAIPHCHPACSATLLHLRDARSNRRTLRGELFSVKS
jgi:hypothetical protein